MNQKVDFLARYPVTKDNGPRVTGPAALCEADLHIEKVDVKYVTYDVGTSVDRLITLGNQFASKTADIKGQNCNLRVTGGGVTTYSPLPAWYVALGLNVDSALKTRKLTMALEPQAGFPTACLGALIGFQATNQQPSDLVTVIIYVNSVGYNQPNPPFPGAPGVLKYSFDVTASPNSNKRLAAYLWSWIEQHANYDHQVVNAEMNANLNIVLDKPFTEKYIASSPSSAANDAFYSEIIRGYGDETLAAPGIVIEMHFNNDQMIFDSWAVTAGDVPWNDFVESLIVGDTMNRPSGWLRQFSGSDIASDWFQGR